jgi:hypothetical protein
MITKKWRTSERRYGILVERHVSVAMSDGVIIDADVFRPDDGGRFPVILCVHPYDNPLQSAPLMPHGFAVGNGMLEAGDPNFFVRRGYAHIIANVRGSGRSGGYLDLFQPREAQDSSEMIEWIATQPWCDGNVGMFGVSYFAMAAQRAAALNPPHLRAIFAPYAVTDFYRDSIYHGGILAHGFTQGIRGRSLSNPRYEPDSWYLKKYGKEKFDQATAAALQDEDLCAVPYVREALATGVGPLDNYLNYLDGEYFRERSVDYTRAQCPAYLGACWGIYGLHLPGAFRSWEYWKGPKKMTIGPPVYLDRPLYQYAYESIRWFDHWLKGMDNGVMEEPPIKLFIVGTGEWQSAAEWPLPETRWTPFHLHEKGLLSEHEFWPNEGHSTFENSFLNHGELTFMSPPLVENTEILGPMVLNLYASTTDTEVLWFVALLDIDPEGGETLLTRGWLRGSQRRTDVDRSKPWQPYHPHRGREPLSPGEIYEFNIEVMPYGILFRPGHRIAVRIKCSDDETPGNFLEAVASGHLWRQTASRVTVYHDAEHPSHLLLPVTRGNILETFISGGTLPQEAYRKF